MVLTPSAKGAFLAGIGFWTLLWLGVAKLDEIAECLHLRKFLGTEKCLAWINRHRALSLLGTEAMNYGSHGIQPLGVSFAIGGSIVNIFVILFLLPIRSLLKRRSVKA